MPAEVALREAENHALTGAPGSFYSGSGRSNANPKNRPKLSGNRKKGIGAMVVIIGLLMGGGAFLGSSHSLLAPAMESLITDATDTQHASFVLRTNRLFNYANNHSGASSNVTKKYGDIPANAQVKTKQGRVATFFDKMATKIYGKLGLSRNLFNGYKQTGDSDADMENFRNTMNPEYDNNSSSIRGQYEEEVQKRNPDGSLAYDENGDPIMVKENVNDTDLDGRSNASIDEATAKANNFVNSTSAKVAKVATQAGSIGCAMMRVGATISTIVAANAIYQSINYFMNFMEPVSKMKYGQGSDSPINESLNLLTAPVNATVSDVNQFNEDGSGGQEVSFYGAPVQANGMQMMLSYALANSATNKLFSIERTGNAIAKFLNMSPTEVQTCAGVQAGTAVVSIVTTIGTFGVSAIGQIIFNFFSSAAVSVSAAAILSFIVPTIAKVLFTNVFETTTGIPAGELLASGASAANTRVGRSGSGQSLASGEVATAYSRVTQDVIAMEAEADRQNRSPFDITSKNTFLGSIAYKLLPMTLLSAKGSTAILTNVNTLTRTTSSSLASLTNSASAASSSNYMANFGDCPNLEAIGAVGDIYCNPITTTDPSLIEMDPNDSNYVQAIEKETYCDDNGNCTIKPDSDLAKYISYCDNRDSPFGVVDANILGNLEKGNAVLGAIPLVGDFLDLINAGTTAENLKWSTGEKCVNTTSNSDWETFKYYQRYIEDQRILDWSGAYGDGQSPVLAYETQYEKEHPLDNSPAGYLARISGITKDDAEIIIALVEYYNFIANYDPSTRLTADDIVTTSEELVHNFETENPTFDFSDDTEINTIISANPNHYIIYNDVRNRSYAA